MFIRSASNQRGNHLRLPPSLLVNHRDSPANYLEHTPQYFLVDNLVDSLLPLPPTLLVSPRDTPLINLLLPPQILPASPVDNLHDNHLLIPLLV